MMGLEYEVCLIGDEENKILLIMHFARYNEEKDLYWMELSHKSEDSLHNEEMGEFIKRLVAIGWEEKKE